jgi:large subunit ribosomal protein L10
LGIKAAQSGLGLKVVYEKGMIIPGSDLVIDVADYRKRLMEAAGGAFSVALKGAYVTPTTAPTLLSMAQQQAKAVAVEAGYVTPATAMEIIAKAAAQAKSLQGKVDEKKTA